ncbi:hypothetical protein ACIOC1_33975 [Streptomyces sp. NPDC088197]|uniref:hypothetical protein n=1 Tax=unclassified Streptomyces TaxID=2593676 RepID=UPI0036E6F1A7
MTTTSALGEALRRDAAVLLESYRSGTWVPDPAERDLAEALARGRWNAHFMRTALREAAPEVRAGRLIDILAPAADILDQAAGGEGVVLQLRVLVDALTTRLWLLWPTMQHDAVLPVVQRREWQARKRKVRDPPGGTGLA